MVSARALIIDDPILRSLAHEGTRPQWNARTTGPADSSFTTAYTSLVGATL